MASRADESAISRSRTCPAGAGSPGGTARRRSRRCVRSRRSPCLAARPARRRHQRHCPPRSVPIASRCGIGGGAVSPLLEPLCLGGGGRGISFPRTEKSNSTKVGVEGGAKWLRHLLPSRSLPDDSPKQGIADGVPRMVVFPLPVGPWIRKNALAETQLAEVELIRSCEVWPERGHEQADGSHAPPSRLDKPKAADGLAKHRSLLRGRLAAG